MEVLQLVAANSNQEPLLASTQSRYTLGKDLPIQAGSRSLKRICPLSLMPSRGTSNSSRGRLPSPSSLVHLLLARTQ